MGASAWTEGIDRTVGDGARAVQELAVAALVRRQPLAPEMPRHEACDPVGLSLVAPECHICLIHQDGSSATAAAAPATVARRLLLGVLSACHTPQA